MANTNVLEDAMTEFVKDVVDQEYIMDIIDMDLVIEKVTDEIDYDDIAKDAAGHIDLSDYVEQSEFRGVEKEISLLDKNLDEARAAIEMLENGMRSIEERIATQHKLTSDVLRLANEVIGRNAQFMTMTFFERLAWLVWGDFPLPKA